MFSLEPERKSRRSHQNSRDGCPQCRKKRIKCSEELPQCQNCVKKNVPCGYLEFPKEKLDKIREKNEKKRRAPPQVPEEVPISRYGNFERGQVFVPVPPPLFSTYSHMTDEPDLAPPPFDLAALPELVDDTSSSSPSSEFSPSPIGLPLHNAIHMPTSFVRGTPKSPKLSFHLLGASSLSDVYTEHEFSSAIMGSVYRVQFWTMIFELSSKLQVYWTFFMDRALNVLLTNSDDRLKLGAHTPVIGPKEFQYLLSQSYVHYDKFIRKLRQSLDYLHIEYPIKISLFAAWSTFLDAHASLSSLRTMYIGTILLLEKFTAGATQMHEITPTVRSAISLLYTRLSTVMIPDYQFQAFEELSVDLQNLQHFILSQSPKNPQWQLGKYHLRKLQGLTKFCQYVVDDFYPKLKYINHHYRMKHGDVVDGDSIRVVSMQMAFELLLRWFRTFSNEALSVGSNTPPMQRLICLAFVTVGETFNAVMGVIPGSYMVHPLNLLSGEYQFDPSPYKLSRESFSPEHYGIVYSATTKLLRTTKYFKRRYGCYIYTTYCQRAKSSVFQLFNEVDHDLSYVPYKDINRIEYDKIYGREVPMASFDISKTGPLKIENYPFLQRAAVEYGWQYIIDIENARCREADPYAFNFKTGCFECDFDAGELVERYALQQEKNMKANMSIDILKNQLESLNSSRMVALTWDI